ncbi:MAG: OmpA family protein, partial [Bacteroidia bacterium]
LEKESFGSPVASVASSDSLRMLKTLAHYYRNDSLKLTELTDIHPILVRPKKPIIDTLVYNILFDIDQSIIEAKQEQQVLNQLANIDKIDEYNIYLEAHTDSTASNNYNLKLSKERRNRVYNLLKKQGYKIHSANAFGEEKPEYTNSTELGRQKNRRVKITLIRKP